MLIYFNPKDNFSQPHPNDYRCLLQRISRILIAPPSPSLTSDSYVKMKALKESLKRTYIRT